MKSYCKQFTMQLKHLSVVGSLYPVRRSESSKFSLCTPDYEPVKQIYVDDKGERYNMEDLKRGLRVKGQYKLEPPVIESLEELKESKLMLNYLDLNIHRVDEVRDHIYPAGTQGYIFQPVRYDSSSRVVKDDTNDLYYEVLNLIVANPDVVVLGKSNLSHHEGLFQLGILHGYVTLQKLCYPEDLNEFEPRQPEVTDDLRSKAQEVASKLVTPFDPTDYRDSYKQRLEGVTEAPGETGAETLMKALESLGV